MSIHEKMKKKYTFLLLLLFVALHLSAQQHLVLIEEFTNTGCNPCASWSPELDQVIEDRLGECIAIKYHSGYPDSSDEYYNYDKPTQQTRLDYYGVTGVPTTFVNGVEIGERTTEMMHYAMPSQPFSQASAVHAPFSKASRFFISCEKSVSLLKRSLRSKSKKNLIKNHTNHERFS